MRGKGASPVRGSAARSSSHQDPGQVDGLGRGLPGLGVTHQAPLVGEEEDLSSGGSIAQVGGAGGGRGATWEGPGNWGRGAGLVTSGVVTPCLSPSMAPYCPQVQGQALSGLICLLCFGASAAATPHWHLLPAFPRPLPSRSIERRLPACWHGPPLPLSHTCWMLPLGTH